MMISYAGNREDVLLTRAFGSVAEGFYVDIGGYRPKPDSVTHVFSERGWSGINVEPGPFFDEFVAARPRDINLKAAVLDFDGEARFSLSPLHPAASTVAAVGGPGREGAPDDAIVPAMRMQTLVDRHVGGRHVHFLKVDAEGAEPAIFGSADWRAFRPEIVLAEAVAPFTNDRVDGQWMHYLTDAGYRHVYFDGISSWFVREESSNLERHFRLPVNQLDYFQVYDARVEAQQDQMNRLAAENEILKAQLADLRAVKSPPTLLTRLLGIKP